MNNRQRIAPFRRGFLVVVAAVAAVTWNVSADSAPASAYNVCASLGHDAGGYYSQGTSACSHYTLTVARDVWGNGKTIYSPSKVGSVKSYAKPVYWPWHAENIYAQSNYII